MAAMAENRMNLAALQQRDPYITGIVDTASQVALYSFSAQSNEWEKTEVEGTLFVYTRSASPINGFMILNRLGLNDMIEPINKNLEFQLQDPFLLYRNGQASICGIWFYDKDECARIGQLMNSLVQIAIDSQEQGESTHLNNGRRERRASESELKLEQKRPSGGSAVSGGDDGALGGGGGQGIAAAINGISGVMNVDIMQMLSKAQDEYDQSSNVVINGAGNKTSSLGKRSAPKPMIDNPNASATKSTNILKPRAVKASPTHADEDEVHYLYDNELAAASTYISVDTLFKQATDKQPQSAQVLPGGQMPPLLQRLMSHPGSYLEEIERNQRGEIHRDDMPKPAGAEAPPSATNGAAVPKLASPPKTVQAMWNDPEPDSPNTALRRTLNILPNSSTGASSPTQHFGGDMGNISIGGFSNGMGGHRISPGFPGLKRTGSSSEQDMMSHSNQIMKGGGVGGGGNKLSHQLKHNEQQQSGANVQKPSLLGDYPHQQLHHHNQPTPPQHHPHHQNVITTSDSSYHHHHQHLQSSSAISSSSPRTTTTNSSSLVSGINPLHESVQSQLRHLTISTSSSLTGQDSGLKVIPPGGGAHIIVDTSQPPPPLPSNIGAGGVSEWLKGSTSSPLKTVVTMGGGGGGLVTPQALFVGSGGSSGGSSGSAGGPAPIGTHSISSQVSASPLQTAAAAAGSGSGGSVLLTPMSFETGARLTPPGVEKNTPMPIQCLVDSDSVSQKSTSPLSVQQQQPDRRGGDDTEAGFNPLTRQQLQQALIHMLKCDPGFLSSIHEAYVTSLQLSLKSDRK